MPNGQYTYTYDGTTGNLTSITAPGGDTLSYSYDGSLLEDTSWTGTIAGTVSRTYDNNFRVTNLSVNGSDIGFDYDDDNLLTQAGDLTLTRDAQNGLLTGTTLGAVTDTYSYNNFGEPASYSASFNATDLYSVTYTRDNLSRITQKSETIGGVTSVYDYTYDTAGRLTQVKKDNITTSTYAYDSNNNRLSFTGPGGTVNGAYDDQDRLTQYGTTTYVYTANGELQSKTVGAQTTTYQYDVLGNLRNVTLPNGTQIDYVIDGQNRRIGKKVNNSLVQGFLYQDLLGIVAELDGNNNVVSRFVHGTRANVPEYMIKGADTYRLITDHLDSVRLVVDVATGNIAQRIDYDEFGVVTTDTNPGFQPFGFAGGLYDPQTGLVRFGARDYDAETGRWTTKEPLRFAGGQTNLYTYAANNPVKFIDPTGLDLIPTKIYIDSEGRVHPISDSPRNSGQTSSTQKLIDQQKNLIDQIQKEIAQTQNPDQRQKLIDQLQKLIDSLKNLKELCSGSSSSSSLGSSSSSGSNSGSSSSSGPSSSNTAGGGAGGPISLGGHYYTPKSEGPGSLDIMDGLRLGEPISTPI